MASMTITQPVPAGGQLQCQCGRFEIRNCTWHKATSRLRVPRRRRIQGSQVWGTVVRPPSSFVKQLKSLLNAGLLPLPRRSSARKGCHASGASLEGTMLLSVLTHAPRYPSSQQVCDYSFHRVGIGCALRARRADKGYSSYRLCNRSRRRHFSGN